jgi:hypothetical protein
MTVGTPPGTGIGMVDGAWLNALAGGLNQTYQAGVAATTAASQANGFHYPSGINILEVDSSVATGSIVLPAAVAGTELTIVNTTANALNVYANPSINQLTGSTDQINGASNATAFTVTASGGANPVPIFYCAKNGAWWTK